MVFFESLGRLNQWGNLSVPVADPGVPFMSYEPEPSKGYGDPPVRAVVDFIARHVSSLPLKVFERGEDDGRERVRGGTLASLVSDPTRSPLPTMRFWYSLIADGLLSDRMLAVAVTEGADNVLRRIPPNRWRIIADGMDEIVGVEIYPPDGRDPILVPVGAEPMILDVGYAHSGARGTRQTETLKRILAEYRESVGYRAAVNAKSARSPFVVLRDRAWPDRESRERFERGMRAFVSGGGSAGSGMLLEDGMRIENLNMFKPIDVGDLEARDKVKVDVANAYGIPAEIMGIREGNFSNLAAYQRMLYGTYLRPYITAFEEALNRGLKDFAAPGEYLEFDVDAQMRGNVEDQYRAFSRATGRPFMTTNEVRARMNLPPVEGGDELVTPLNVLAGGQLSPMDGITGRDEEGGTSVQEEF